MEEQGLIAFVIIGALLWLRFYLWPKKSKFEKAKEAARPKRAGNERRGRLAEGISEGPPAVD